MVPKSECSPSLVRFGFTADKKDSAADGIEHILHKSSTFLIAYIMESKQLQLTFRQRRIMKKSQYCRVVVPKVSVTSFEKIFLK